MNGQRRTSVLLKALWLLLFAHIVFFTGIARSEYPNRPITLIIAMEPGGSLDLSTRGMAVGASAYLKQPLVIENKGGGGGALALAPIANAKPDGYTICCAPADSIIITPMLQKVPFRPLKSFTPIVGYAAAERTALLVKSDSPWKTFKDFIEYAKKNPGKIKYSSAGVGQFMHVAMELIGQQEGIKWVHVPYKGTAPARTALMGGHVDACSSGMGWTPYAQSGALRPLAVYGPTRHPSFPDVPTLRELGYDFAHRTVHGIFGPAGLPADIVNKLETAFTKGRETPEFKTAAESVDLSLVYYNSKEYAHHLEESWVVTEKMLKDAKVIKVPATQPY